MASPIIKLINLSLLLLVCHAESTDKKAKEESKQKKRELTNISNDYFNFYTGSQNHDLNQFRPQITFYPEYIMHTEQPQNDGKGIPETINLQKIYVTPSRSKSQYNTMAPQVRLAPVHEDNGEENDNKNQYPQLQTNQNNYIYLTLPAQHSYSSEVKNTLPQKNLFTPEPNQSNSQVEAYAAWQSTADNSKYKYLPYKYSYPEPQIDFQKYHEDNSLVQQQNQEKSLEGKPFLHMRLVPYYPYNTENESTKQEKDGQPEQGISGLEHYAPQYDERYYNKEISGLMESEHLSKLKAHAQAEAIARSPPVLVHKDISVTLKRPVNIIRTIHLPVPSPVFIPFLQPYKEYIPQPYAVPLEIIRPYIVPIEKTEKIEVEKPVPVEVEKIVEVPVEKKVYVKVDKPVPVERTVPVEITKKIPVEIPIYKPRKLTILRHIWEH